MRHTMYALRMPETANRPKRKAMFLGPRALHNLKVTSARRRTEREAMEDALELLAQRDAQLDAMDDFIKWAEAEWGKPTDEQKSRAAQIWANR